MEILENLRCDDEIVPGMLRGSQCSGTALPVRQLSHPHYKVVSDMIKYRDPIVGV